MRGSLPPRGRAIHIGPASGGQRPLPNGLDYQSTASARSPLCDGTRPWPRIEPAPSERPALTVVLPQGSSPWAVGGDQHALLKLTQTPKGGWRHYHERLAGCAPTPNAILRAKT